MIGYLMKLSYLTSASLVGTCVTCICWEISRRCLISTPCVSRYLPMLFTTEKCIWPTNHRSASTLAPGGYSFFWPKSKGGGKKNPKGTRPPLDFFDIIFFRSFLKIPTRGIWIFFENFGKPGYFCPLKKN